MVDHTLYLWLIDIREVGPRDGLQIETPVPALPVRTAGRLDRQFDTLPHDLEWDLALEIEALAHRLGGGQQFIGRQVQLYRHNYPFDRTGYSTRFGYSGPPAANRAGFRGVGLEPRRRCPFCDS